MVGVNMGVETVRERQPQVRQQRDVSLHMLEDGIDDDGFVAQLIREQVGERGRFLVEKLSKNHEVCAKDGGGFRVSLETGPVVGPRVYSPNLSNPASGGELCMAGIAADWEAEMPCISWSKASQRFNLNGDSGGMGRGFMNQYFLGNFGWDPTVCPSLM